MSDKYGFAYWSVVDGISVVTSPSEGPSIMVLLMGPPVIRFIRALLRPSLRHRGARQAIQKLRLHNNKAKQTPAGEAYRSNLHNDVVQNRLTATSAAQLMKRSRVGPYPTCVRSIGEHSSQIPSSSSCSAATPSWPRRRSVICSQVR